MDKIANVYMQGYNVGLEKTAAKFQGKPVAPMKSQSFQEFRAERRAAALKADRDKAEKLMPPDFMKSHFFKGPKKKTLEDYTERNDYGKGKDAFNKMIASRAKDK